MTMHHHSPDAAEAKDLDYLRVKLREAAYSREVRYMFGHPQEDLYRKGELLDRGGHPTVDFGEMSLGTLQLLFAKLNNAELQAWYNQSSKQELREIARARRISITHAERKTVHDLRARLVNVDRCWLQSRRLHAVEATLCDLQQNWDVDDVIYAQFGCMPCKMAKNKLVLKEGEDGPSKLRHQGNYVQVSPGRGKPKIRFQRKLPGLVPNQKMWDLVKQARDCLRPPKAWADEPFGIPEWASGTNEERAAKRRRYMAEL